MKQGFPSYEKAKSEMIIHQNREQFQRNDYIIFKPSQKTFHFCPLNVLHKVPLKFPNISAYELVSDSHFCPSMGCHTYLDIDIKNPKVTYRQVITRTTEYLKEAFFEYTNAKVDIEGFRFFWAVATDDPNKLSIHGTIQHPCFIWKYGLDKDERVFSLRHFIQLVNKLILERQDEVLTGDVMKNDQKIKVSFIDEAPYNGKGNAAMRLCGSTKNGKRRLLPINNYDFEFLEQTKEVLSNYRISEKIETRDFFQITTLTNNLVVEKKDETSEDIFIPENLDQIISKIDNVTFFKKKKNLVYLKSNGPRKCLITGITHVNNNCYLRFTNGQCFFHCYSQLCEGHTEINIDSAAIVYQTYDDHRLVPMKNGFVDEIELDKYIRSIFRFIDRPRFPAICMKTSSFDCQGNEKLKWDVFFSNRSHIFTDRKWRVERNQPDNDAKKTKK